MNNRNGQNKLFALIFDIISENHEINVTVHSILNNPKYNLYEIQRDVLYDSLETFKKQELINIKYHETNSIAISVNLLSEGNRVKKLPNRYLDFIKELNKKTTDKKLKEQRDDNIKDLQLKELNWKIDKMQNMQTEFWQSGINRDNRQKWQFWLTIAVSALAFSLGLFNFFKK